MRECKAAKGERVVLWVSHCRADKAQKRPMPNRDYRELAVPMGLVR